MTDSIKHECGIALIRLKKPMEFYHKKYGSFMYGINKMFLMMQKQRNRGQDGAGFASIKLDTQPGQRYISRIRSIEHDPIQLIFSKISKQIRKKIKDNTDLSKNISALPHVGNLMLGHVRYGTFGGNGIEGVHPFLRQNNWMHRNLIVAGNFNMTNVNELFDNLVNLGQHPKEKADAVTIMEKIGHFLDDAVSKIYKKLKQEGVNKMEASALIAERLNLARILKKSSKEWDGGYVIAGMLGHGDAFVLRDPVGIRPAYYYDDDEVLVVASERPAIQAVFNISYSQIKELPPASAIIIKKDNTLSIETILKPQSKRSCSFERIYFSRGNDSDIYQERKKLGKLLLPQVYKAIDGDTKNTVFSYIPYTAETSFYGLINELQEQKKKQIVSQLDKKIDLKYIKEQLTTPLRIEKIAVKDIKTRTFITQDVGRDDLVMHSYDTTYGVIQPTDNLVILDDSIVRGTTLQKSILTILDKLKPKKIIVVSSAPQIKYPDCYGIDMSKIQDFIAFKATLELHKEKGTYDKIIKQTYKNCKNALLMESKQNYNYVKDLYQPFTDIEISNKIAEILSKDLKYSKLEVIFQTPENLRKACPDHLGDWYFTGKYPTKGGNRVVNRSFINFYEGKKDKRSYN